VQEKKNKHAVSVGSTNSINSHSCSREICLKEKVFRCLQFHYNQALLWIQVFCNVTLYCCVRGS